MENRPSESSQSDVILATSKFIDFRGGEWVTCFSHNESVFFGSIADRNRTHMKDADHSRNLSSLGDGETNSMEKFNWFSAQLKRTIEMCIISLCQSVGMPAAEGQQNSKSSLLDESESDLVQSIGNNNDKFFASSSYCVGSFGATAKCETGMRGQSSMVQSDWT